MGKSAPDAPDYRGAAEEQADASKQTTAAQTWANRPNMTTPWGSQTWNTTQTIDPSTGQPVTQWQGDISLTPEQQAALDSQQNVQLGRSQAAEQMLGRATDSLGQPLDYSGISAGADRIESGGLSARDWRQEAQDAALEFNRPMQEQRQAALESQLANMGLTRGSAAWDREMQRLGDQTTRDNLQVFDSARAEAALQGQLDQQRLYMQVQAGGFNNALRQQEIAEMMSQRQAPLNELNALLTGQQVQSPQMPNFNTAGQSQGAQYLTAANQQYGAGLDAYNVDQANAQGTMAGAGALLSLFAMSDERLKRDKVLLGVLPSGIQVWSYRFVGETKRKIGVMAQQVRDILPNAVIEGADGWLRVDYSQVLEA